MNGGRLLSAYLTWNPCCVIFTRYTFHDVNSPQTGRSIQSTRCHAHQLFTHRGPMPAWGAIAKSTTK